MKLRETHDYIGLRLQQSRKPMDFLCTNSEFGLSIRPIPLSSYLPWFPMYCAPLVRSSRLDYSQMQARVFWRSHEEVDVVALHVAGDRVGRADEWSGSGRHGIDRSTGYNARHI